MAETLPCTAPAGYPRGLKHEEIPLGARIFAVADTLDAMISIVHTSKGLPMSAARAGEMQKFSGTQFDGSRRGKSIFLSKSSENTLCGARLS